MKKDQIDKVEIFKRKKNDVKYLWFNFTLQNAYKNELNLPNKRFNMYIRLQNFSSETNDTQNVQINNITSVEFDILNQNDSYY